MKKLGQVKCDINTGQLKAKRFRRAGQVLRLTIGRWNAIFESYSREKRQQHRQGACMIGTYLGWGPYGQRRARAAKYQSAETLLFGPHSVSESLDFENSYSALRKLL